ncbi:LysR substrate-binding domain-containing protein [Edaphovirga cremea]|uniref:LysR substrate-binding domain-containing protein n=1 Tax=Edaphovirga cremea TaxID=2267246 RepID=UPI001FE4F33E|nr:LysR substrate-binding domain-containing protein [Edaphovirga cremea]
MDFFVGVISPDISLHDFIEEHLAVARFCVIARKEHPLINCTSLSQLRGAKWYLPRASAGYFSDMEKLIFPDGKDPTCSVLFGDSTTVAEQLILNEDYLFVGPQAMLTIPHLKDILRQIPIKEKIPNGSYSLIYRQQQMLTPIAGLLINEIRAAYIELMAREVR